MFSAQRKGRETSLKHRRSADDLWAGLAVAEMGTIGHRKKLEAPRSCLNGSSSITAAETEQLRRRRR
jgi:hypothetical protein